MTEAPANWNDERYRVPGTNLFNATQWSRENVPKPPPRYRVNDEVVLYGTDYITRVYQDCDGTPLYETANHGNGYSDESLMPAVEDAWLNDDLPYAGIVLALRALGWTVEPPQEEA